MTVDGLSILHCEDLEATGMGDTSFDIAIIGAGILGLATGMKLVKKYSGLRAVVLEKEDRIGAHQTGHNSGVIHSGIYYKPGSLKARLCVSGARELVSFCMEHNIAHDICGKVVVAARSDQLPALDELYRRGIENGIRELRMLDNSEVREFEPFVNCIRGLLVPATGIVDYAEVARAYARVFTRGGGQILLKNRVLKTKETPRGVRLDTSRGQITAGALINCAGLYSDKVARASGFTPPCRIVPFRGEYYRIKPERAHLVKNLIYPVPDPKFPFLGVHFTRMIDGRIEAGPNAVLAFAREGYSRVCVNPRELLEVLAYRGFHRLAARYWRNGVAEMARSISKNLFVRSLQELVPIVRDSDLGQGGAGVRAQALGMDGKLLDDFVVLRNKRMVHVLNAPSPAATSSLAIAGHLLEEFAEKLNF